jgi:hypothetical protein
MSNDSGNTFQLTNGEDHLKNDRDRDQHLPTMPDPVHDRERGQQLPTEPDPSKKPTPLDDPRRLDEEAPEKIA